MKRFVYIPALNSSASEVYSSDFIPSASASETQHTDFPSSYNRCSNSKGMNGIGEKFCLRSYTRIYYTGARPGKISKDDGLCIIK